MLIRELLPELDDEQFRRLETYVSSTSLLERFGYRIQYSRLRVYRTVVGSGARSTGADAEPSMFTRSLLSLPKVSVTMLNVLLPHRATPHRRDFPSWLVSLWIT